MKLSKLHIINFGKLTDYTYQFNNEINSFVFENGWGKTTLSNFIFAMLYGFNGNGKSISNNLRKKYYPWNNGPFGGSLEFYYKGKDYLIERTFGLTAKDDTFVLYDLATNKISNNFTSNIGFEILGLDYASFERSVYIPQKDLDLGFNEDLKSKLANVIGGTNDVQNFESAINLISSKYKEIKKTKFSGKLIDKKVELEDVEKEIKIIDSNINASNLIKEDISNKEEKIKELEEKRTLVFNNLQELNQYEQYKKALKQLQYHENELQELTESLKFKEQLLNGNSVSDLDIYKNKINEYEKLIIERDLLRKNSVNNSFDDVITSNELNDLEQKVLSFEKKKKNQKQYSFIIFSSTLLLIMGIVSLIMKLFVLGEVLIGIGAITLLVISFLLIKSSKHKNELLEDIKYILKRNNLDLLDINNGLNYLKIQKNEQIKNLENKVKINDSINELELKIDSLKNEISSYLSLYTLKAIDFNLKINELEHILIDISRIKQSIISKESYINKFKNENNLDVRIEEVIGDFESLNNSFNDLNNKISFLNQEKSKLVIRLSIYEQELVKKEELLGKKDYLNNEIKNMERSYQLLKDTEEMLMKANDSLLAKYVKPMKDKLNEYLALVSNKNFFIDTEFNFTYEENGIRREIDYYSKGIQQIIVLCMRFALIDCLYQEDKPFIILDDSFVDFDEKNLNVIQKIMDNLKKEYQIIYFTCHSSRQMK